MVSSQSNNNIQNQRWHIIIMDFTLAVLTFYRVNSLLFILLMHSVMHYTYLAISKPNTLGLLICNVCRSILNIIIVCLFVTQAYNVILHRTDIHRVLNYMNCSGGCWLRVALHTLKPDGPSTRLVETRTR